MDTVLSNYTYHALFLLRTSYAGRLQGTCSRVPCPRAKVFIPVALPHPCRRTRPPAGATTSTRRSGTEGRGNEQDGTGITNAMGLVEGSRVAAVLFFPLRDSGWKREREDREWMWRSTIRREGLIGNGEREKQRVLVTGASWGARSQLLLPGTFRLAPNFTAEISLFLKKWQDCTPVSGA